MCTQNYTFTFSGTSHERRPGGGKRRVSSNHWFSRRLPQRQPHDLLGIFFQDDWKVRPNLTLSAGLRYPYFGAITDKDDHMGALIFGSGTSLLTGIQLKTRWRVGSAKKMNFGPQLGFNWSPDWFKTKLVVRGGFGLNYNQQQIATANNDDGNPPGTSSIPGPGSTGPTFIDPNIIYAVSSSPHNYFGYPANPHAITTFNSAGLPTGGGAGLGGFPNNMPTEYAEHYSLDVEYELGHALVANLGYTGSVGRHLLYNYDSNAFGEIQGDALNPLITGINTFGAGGKSSNNMMLAGLKHDFSHTFSAEGQFTWGHSEDTDSGPYSRSPYLYISAYSYSRSDFDIGKSFKAFGVWQPVIFHGNQSWMEKVAGEWSLSGIWTFHTGYGWTPTYTAPHQIYCDVCGYGYQSLRPHYLGGAGTSTSNSAFETGSNFPNPGTMNTGVNNDSDNYFSVPNYGRPSPTVPDSSQPPSFLCRESVATLPGPDYGMSISPSPQSIRFAEYACTSGEGAKLEVKANFNRILNTLNIDPSSISNNIDGSRPRSGDERPRIRVWIRRPHFGF